MTLLEPPPGMSAASPMLVDSSAVPSFCISCWGVWSVFTTTISCTIVPSLVTLKVTWPDGTVFTDGSSEKVLVLARATSTVAEPAVWVALRAGFPWMTLVLVVPPPAGIVDPATIVEAAAVVPLDGCFADRVPTAPHPAAMSAIALSAINAVMRWGKGMRTSIGLRCSRRRCRWRATSSGICHA